MCGRRRASIAASPESLKRILQKNFTTQLPRTTLGTGLAELEELYENCGKTPLKNALKKYRKAEEEDVDAAIADFEEGVEHEGYDNE